MILNNIQIKTVPRFSLSGSPIYKIYKNELEALQHILLSCQTESDIGKK